MRSLKMAVCGDMGSISAESGEKARGRHVMSAESADLMVSTNYVHQSFADLESMTMRKLTKPIKIPRIPCSKGHIRSVPRFGNYR